MRRVVLILFAATLALIVLSPAAFSADKETTSGADDQYTNDDTNAEQQAGDEGTAPPEGEESTAPETTADESPKPVPFESLDVPLSEVSQGSVVEGPGLPEENFPAYSQVVDNSTKGSFKAPGWKTESSIDGHHGKDYAVAQPGKNTKQAQFKVEAPATDTYSIYVWYPAGKENGTTTRFGVTTTSGTKWTQVNQQKDGGFWGKIGEYELKEGESYAVKIAPGKDGQAVADAIAVVRGVQSAPPEDEATASSGDSTFQAAGGRPTGRDVLRKARRYLGTKYAWGACTQTRMSCTCLTKKSFRPFGHDLPMSEEKQWRYAKNRGRVISSKSDLKPGDLLFFKENGSNGGITHVGVAARSGWLVHSSSWYDKVVEKEHRHLNGFYRGVRLRLR